MTWFLLPSIHPVLADTITPPTTSCSECHKAHGTTNQKKGEKDIRMWGANNKTLFSVSIFLLSLWTPPTHPTTVQQHQHPSSVSSIVIIIIVTIIIMSCSNAENIHGQSGRECRGWKMLFFLLLSPFSRGRYHKHTTHWRPLEMTAHFYSHQPQHSLQDTERFHGKMKSPQIRMSIQVATNDESMKILCAARLRESVSPAIIVQRWWMRRRRRLLPKSLQY